MAIPNFNSYKKVYTTGDQFTLTGSDFKGFVELVDGVAKEVSTGKTLIPKGTYSTDLFYTEYFQDRVVADVDLSLPNTTDECIFSLNDNLDYSLFKYKLDNIRDNNTYVYSKLFIASNKLPFTDSIRYATVDTPTSTEFTVNVSDVATPEFKANEKFANNHYLSAFGNVIAATAQTNLEYLTHFSLFAATKTNLLSLTGSDTDLVVIEDTTGYEMDGNDLAFGEIGGIASTSDSLYVSDKVRNVVIRYDIAGYNNNDSSLRNTRNFLELVGGFGGSTRQTKFKKPTLLAANKSEVAVFDSGNKVIKLYDSEFNFITRITSINLNVETMGAMAFDPDFNSLYVITYRDITTAGITNRVLYLYRYSDDSYRFKEEFILDDRIALDEVVNSLTFSGTDSNYWYFGTDKTVYKKLKTRPTKVIGKFRSERLFLLNNAVEEEVIDNVAVTINNRWNFSAINFNNADFIWNLGVETNAVPGVKAVDGLLEDSITSFSLFPGISSYDRAIMLTSGRLYFFNEPTGDAYQRVIKDENYNNYGSTGFSLNDDAFIQASVINTELFKVINDTLTLKNNIVGRFTGEYVNDILELGNYNYDVDFKLLLTQEIENLYLHTNEENIVGTINRCFELIYNLQVDIMNIVKVNVESNVQNVYNKSGFIQI
tara:strand:+ start:5046 stop:7010 length:1965 start_codon:yes stop_codon:yes gene_type:complete